MGKRDIRLLNSSRLSLKHTYALAHNHETEGNKGELFEGIQMDLPRAIKSHSTSA